MYVQNSDWLMFIQGTIKQTLSNKESEGKPLMIELEGDYLTVATDTGYIKMWDLSRRYAILLSNSMIIYPHKMSATFNPISIGLPQPFVF